MRWRPLILLLAGVGLAFLLFPSAALFLEDATPPAFSSQTGTSNRPGTVPEPHQFRPPTTEIVAQGDPPDLTLHFSAEVRGWMEPCG